MTNNCLVTKLKENIDNDNLLKLGELCFGVNSTAALACQVIDGKELHLEIIKGNGTFNQTGTKKLTITQNSSSYAASVTSNEPLIISVDNKYYIKSLQINSGTKDTLDAKNLEYCINLTSCVGYVWGADDLNNFKNKSNLTSLYIEAKNPFDLNDILGYNSLTSIDCMSDVDCDISTIEQNCPKIKHIRVGGHLTGDGSLFGLTKSSAYIGSYDTKIPNTNITWKTTRPVTAPFVELIYVNLGDDLDAMLINQANLTYSGSAATGWTRGLSVYGNLGSSQEVTNAIAAIKAKGLPVHINGSAY